MPQDDDKVRDMEMALRAALASARPEASVYVRRMFGGAGFWADGLIFAAWFGGSIALKLDPADAAELLKVPGAVERSEMGKYVEVPPAWIDDPDALAPWVARSVDYVHRSSKKRRRTS